MLLVLAITYQGVAFPILFRLLPKQGNSDTPERIELINRYIDLFGKNTIKCLVADREFVGQKWMKYLNEQQIRYYLRIRENFLVKNPRNGKIMKASCLFASLKVEQSTFLYKIYYVNNQLCYLAAARLKNRDGKPELQIIVSFNKPELAIQAYKDRWQIETAFKAIKTSGFNIEDTHLTSIPRLEKLFAIVIVAFTWAYLVGIHKHKYVKP